MGKIWLPPESDIALAARGWPNTSLHPVAESAIARSKAAGCKPVLLRFGVAGLRDELGSATGDMITVGSNHYLSGGGFYSAYTDVNNRARLPINYLSAVSTTLYPLTVLCWGRRAKASDDLRIAMGAEQGSTNDLIMLRSESWYIRASHSYIGNTNWPNGSELEDQVPNFAPQDMFLAGVCIEEGGSATEPVLLRYVNGIQVSHSRIGDVITNTTAFNNKADSLWFNHLHDLSENYFATDNLYYSVMLLPGVELSAGEIHQLYKAGRNFNAANDTPYLISVPDAATQTLYVVVQPSGTAAPSVAQVKDGTGTGGAAAYASSKAATTTNPYTFNADNLTAGTEYTAYFVWSDGTNDTAVFTGSTFTTESAAQIVEASMSLGAGLATTNAPQADLSSIVGYNIGQAFADSAVATYAAGIAVGIDQLLASTSSITLGPQVYEAAMSLGVQQAVIQSASAIFEASASFSSGLTASSGGLATLYVTAALGLDLSQIQEGVILTGPQTYNASVTVGVVHGLETISVANLYAATALGHDIAVTLAGGTAIDSALSFALQHDFVTSLDISVEGLLPLGLSQAVASSSQADLLASATLAHQAALQAVAGAILEAGLDLSSIRSVTTSGFALVVGVVTPEGRRINITVEDLTVAQGDQDRTFTIPE